MTIASRTPEGRPLHCPVCGSDLGVDPSVPSDDAPCPDCGHLLWFAWEDLGDVQVAKLSGKLLGPEPMEQFVDAFQRRSGQVLVLDFSDVEYTASRFLSRLIDLKRKVGLTQGRLRVRNVRPELREVFRICRLDQVLEIED